MYNIEEAKNYFVYIEQRNNKIIDVSLELVSKAQKLASVVEGYKVVGVLLGNNVSNLVPDVFKYGADKVIVVDHITLKDYTPEPYTKALAMVVEAYKPDGLFVGATSLGRDLGPRVAGRLKTGLTADATMIDVDPLNEGDKLLWITRPAFGGNLYGTIICPNHRPQMATIRPGVFEKEVYNNNGDVINFDANLSSNDIKQDILEIVDYIKEGIDISKADIIISGGRGIGGKDGFLKLEEIASKIDAVVGGSRGAVDLGWINKDKQVGQTGKTVKPQIYIACGISGAVQHTAGMDKSDCIIAINKDQFAPIFDFAHIGIVGDVFEVLDELKNEIVKLKEGKN